MDDVIKIVVLSNETPLVTKIQELPGREIGEPDCLLIDPCGLYFVGADNVSRLVYGDHTHKHEHEHEHEQEDGHHHHPNQTPEQEQGFALSRYMPKKLLADCRMPISSANILTILEPSPALVSEYLVTISD